MKSMTLVFDFIKEKIDAEREFVVVQRLGFNRQVFRGIDFGIFTDEGLRRVVKDSGHLRISLWLGSRLSPRDQTRMAGNFR